MEERMAGTIAKATCNITEESMRHNEEMGPQEFRDQP